MASDSSPERESGRLAPGVVLAHRYELQKYLGGGAMGDVYRARDTSLGQHIALKIPRRSHPRFDSLQDLLFGEVKKAQAVAHANVCRVFEVAVDRDHDLTILLMELLDGMTLEEALAQPDDYLSREQKLRLVHELCAGLRAIHEQNLIHRDLKPSNVMIDSRGQAKILDFGLAAWSEELVDPAEGTFLYKAPEQVKGGKVCRQTDLFSLGLILYEIFLGRLPAVGRGLPRTVDEVREQRDEVRRHLDRAILRGLAIPGETRKLEIEPPLAQEIRQCLEEDPSARPQSTAEIVRTLPPAPLIPPRVERLLNEPQPRWTPRAAWSALAATVLGLGLVAFLSPGTQPTQPAIAGESPAELEIRARETLVRLGFEGAHKDRRSGFTYTSDPDRPVQYWYRQSPRALPRWRKGSAFHRFEDPPLTRPGEVGVHLDPQGRLLRLDAVPDGTSGETLDGAPVWDPLLRAAGLDPRVHRPVAPSWTPPVYADLRRAWVGDAPELTGGELRVEAAMLGGHPVAFRALGSEMEPPRQRASAEDARRGLSPLGTLVHCLGLGVVLVGAPWLARRRLRDCLADRPAAFRLAVCVFIGRVLVGLFGTSHRWSPLELDLALQVFARGLLLAALVWVIYIAVEPWVRYYSPRRGASWVRLMYGRVRDPLVGRDLLVGGLFGLAILVWARLYVPAASWLGAPAPKLDRLGTLAQVVGQDWAELQTEALASLPRALAMALYAAVHGLLLALLVVGVLVLLRRLVESTGIPKGAWISRSMGFFLYVTVIYPGAGPPALDLVASIGTAALAFTVLFRFGFLAGTTAIVFGWVLSSHPLTLDPTSWALPGALVPLLLTLGISLWGFRAVLRGRALAQASGAQDPAAQHAQPARTLFG